jgi:hypothetical protein
MSDDQAWFLVRCKPGLHTAAYNSLAYAILTYPAVENVYQIDAQLVDPSKVIKKQESSTNAMDRWAV